MDWDERPLPPGWSLGFDEENQRSCFFHYDTTPPTISYIHPLDIDSGTDPSQMPPTISSRRITSRPLPKPPEFAPAYESSQKEPLSLQSSPLSPAPAYSTLLTPVTPKPPPSVSSPKQGPSQTVPVMQNPPPKLSAAQQLYASSFSDHKPSVPSLPPPSLQGQNNNSDRQSLYKNHIASYVQPSPPALRPRSPTSTISSFSSIMNPSSVPSPSFSSFEPQSPPYSERSLSDEGPQLNPSFSNARNDPSYPRGRPKPDPCIRTISTHSSTESTPRTNRNTTYTNLQQPTRTLFDLKRVNVEGNNTFREVRNVTTAAKPPPGQAQLGVSQITNPTLTQTSMNPVLPSGVGFGAAINRPGTAASGASAFIPIAQPTLPIAPPPPPLNVQQPMTPTPSSQPSIAQLHQHQQGSTAPVRPQNIVPHQSPSGQQYQQPQHPQYLQQLQQQPHQQPTLPPQNTHASANANTNQPTKPNKQPHGFMTSFSSAFANSFGKTAGQIGAQALMSSLGIEDEGSDDGGIFDSINSGSAELSVGDNSGGGGADGCGDPAPAPEPVTLAEGEYVPLPTGPGTHSAIPPSDPGAYYPPPQDQVMTTAYPHQPTGTEYQTVYSTQVQYSSTSYNAELPTIEFNHNSGGGGHNSHNDQHGGNTGGHGQTNTQWNSYTNQTNLPTGAQQPYRPQQPIMRATSHQAHSPGWNPYHHQ